MGATTPPPPPQNVYKKPKPKPKKNPPPPPPPPPTKKQKPCVPGHREKAGYDDVVADVHCRDGSVVSARVYTATADNPHFIGEPAVPAPLGLAPGSAAAAQAVVDAMAAHILASEGPSGRNEEYVRNLHRCAGRWWRQCATGVAPPPPPSVGDRLRRVGLPAPLTPGFCGDAVPPRLPSCRALVGYGAVDEHVQALCDAMDRLQAAAVEAGAPVGGGT